MKPSLEPVAELAVAEDLLGQTIEAKVAASARHSIGQYFTPPALVELVLSLVGPPDEADGKVLEPACGSGRFLLAAQKLWNLCPEQLCGCETDPVARHAAEQQLPEVQILPQDFLSLRPNGGFARVVGNPPYIRNRGRGRDLYADFVERAIDHLGEGGRLALVLSNSWLDVDFGRRLRARLLENCALEWLIESSAERWFREARVNTMILIARRCDDPAQRAAQSVRFAQVKDPLPADPVVVREVAQESLRAEISWGPYLRAPELYFSVLEAERAVPLVPLGSLAEIRRGFTTNDNRFFYPPADSGIEQHYLRPLFKSPRRSPGLLSHSSDLPEQVLVCPFSRQELKHRGHKGMLSWLDQHRPELSSSSWRLPDQRAARLFLVKGVADRHRQPLFDRPVFADQQLYLVHPSPPLREEALCALLNSSWGRLSLEMAGRVNFGDGVLWLSLGDARDKIMVPDLRALSPSAEQQLVQALLDFPRQPVPAVSQARKPEEDLWWQAQEELDRQVGALLNLSTPQQEELRKVVVERCRTRLKVAE
ncbi:MAG: hypothetical protein CMP23_10900 [Rickettsiales bacterium]|nr:hypothetical protein [Rickettsiales bacterium]